MVDAQPSKPLVPPTPAAAPQSVKSSTQSSTPELELQQPPAQGPTPTQPAPVPSAEVPPQPVPSSAPRRLGAYGEVAIVTAALLLLARALDYAPGFTGLQPSPMWFGVLWGAMRGGLMPGLLAALLAGMVHALGQLIEAGDHFEVLGETVVTWPVFAFVAGAYLVGQARDLLGQDLQRLRLTRERLKNGEARQRRENEVLEHANRELKRRIFDRSFDFDSLVATVARSEIDDAEHMFEAPLGMLVDFCGATKCSALLVLPDGVLDLAANRGWTEEEIRPRLQAANSSTRVLRAIVEAQAIVDVADDDVSTSGPLLVAPIADGTGVIKALLCIDEIPPSRFDESTVKTFLGIASWLATNVRRVQISDATGESRQQMMQVLKSNKYIGSVADLAERIHLEDARRQRYGVETEMIAIRLLDVRVNMAEYIESIETFLINVLNSAVRLTDDVYQFGFAGCYVLVLTGCKPGNGEKMIERLDARFTANGDRELGPIDLRHYAATSEAPTLAAQLPLLTDHFFGSSPVPLEQRCPVPEPRAQRSGNAEEFARRLRLEMELSRRFQVDLNMVDFRREGPGFGVGPMIARHLWNSVGTLLRVTDGIYVMGPNRCVVLLPFTSCLDASRIWARLDESLRRTIPADYYKEVRAEFLALADTDVRETMHYLVGEMPEVEVGRMRTLAPIVSESELQELAFSEAEFAGLHALDQDLENAFRVIASSGVDLPALPSPEAMTKRWEEVFEKPGAAPMATAGVAVATPPEVAEADATMRRLLVQIADLRALCLRLRAEQAGSGGNR